MYTYNNSSTFLPVPLVCLFFSLFLVACGGGGGGSGSSNSPPTTQSTIPLTNAVRNIQLTNGVPIQMVFPVTVAAGVNLTARGNASINIAKTLEKATISAAPLPRNETRRFETWKMLAEILVKSAFANNAQTASVTTHISYSGDPNVCNSIYQFGPYSLTGMIGSAVTSDTSSITATDAVVDITNSGAYDICVKTIPPIDGFFTVTDVVVDFEECAAPTVDIVGTWTGTYQCDNFGIPDDPIQPITLTITQNSDGSFRYIDDGNAIYDGHLCGDVFKFNGGMAGSFTESGTLRFSSSSSATKSSRWNSIPAGTQGGTCTDTLQKQ